ncbi:MAG: helicase-related protein [Candidatus Anstonellales archaeon]
MKAELREYQKNIVESALSKGNTLVVLPTGLGKTLVAFAVMERVGGRCIFMAPTKPLCEQHWQSYRELTGKEGVLITGESRNREDLWKCEAIFATPQTVRNDMRKGLVKDASLIVFDEAHRAVGDYAYVEIAQKFDCLFLALTASPGGKKARIEEVVKNLKIKNIEIRAASDEDVKGYVKNIEIEWVKVGLGPIAAEIKELKGLLEHYAKLMSEAGFPLPLKSKAKLIEVGKKIMGIQHGMKYRLLVNYNVALHLNHMLELLETESVHAFLKYLDGLRAKQGKSAAIVSRHPKVIEIEKRLKGMEHPKMGKLLELVERIRGKKVIIFAQYREQVRHIVEKLKEKGIKAEVFIGKKEGYSRKKQEEVISRFRSGEIDIMVASSIGEEGLDIPKVDVVVFYEPIPSEIRTIQRRGRAGRFMDGKVYVLMSEGTRDEFHYWASFTKEKKMKSILGRMRKEMDGRASRDRVVGAKEAPKEVKRKGQTTISDFL